MDINRDSFKNFSPEEAKEWGIKQFRTWLPKLQNQDYQPQTPVEMFFRFYTQSNGDRLNVIPRMYGIENYDYEESDFNRDMFVDSIAEINEHRLTENIVVYRYIAKPLVKGMVEWGASRSVKRNAVLVDRGYLSTTLSIEAVRSKRYANVVDHSLFIIYVPKGTPCVYVDLISDMHEQEVLFAPGIKLKVLSKHLFGKFVECVIIDD